MPNWILRSIGAMKPPPINDEEAIMAWRWMMFIGLVATMAVLAIHIALAKGLVPDHPGFVESVEFEAFVDRYMIAQESDLDAALLDLRERQCIGIRDGNREMVLMTEGRIRERMREYRQLTDRELIMPTCREVGVNVSTEFDDYDP